MTEFSLYPSLDIVNKRALTSKSAIEITQRKGNEKKEIGSPLDIAFTYQNSGADWIHIVDLDAASGKKDNSDIIISIIKNKNIKMKTQVCGGIRTIKQLDKYINAGCSRVNISSMVFDNPKLCELILKEYGDKVAIALDVKLVGFNYQLTTQGWNKLQGSLCSTIEWLEQCGCTRYVVTDTNKGGMMNRPNITLINEVLKMTNKPIISGGGISNLSDIRTLKSTGVEGTILGQVIHSNKLPLNKFIDEAKVLNYAY
ncbi:HisA/HisF-related TIM barrel protein [Aliivibrio sp. S10_S31]|uniref:HisA/HisF-related TIM barrel protein n=1 Tax=Aliivibrio sp. S10_S31 TaxID=2720224 RepID=UPI0016805CBF|nr:1-(5-phosphoribosyl)-5-[(5-phosphoribosylamino)methylideneamino] imidazole-4-carboxamide isomerase [Aliivibrio sp. S10_S31]